MTRGEFTLNSQAIIILSGLIRIPYLLLDSTMSPMSESLRMKTGNPCHSQVSELRHTKFMS